MARLATVLVGLVGCWWAAAVVLHAPAYLLPTPADVAAATGQHWPHLLRQTAVTAWHAAGGFAIAAVLGTGVAVGLSAVPWLRQTALPLLVALQAVPKVAVAPLLIVWLGFGHTAKVTLVVLLSFFPVLLATLAGLASTPSELVELARSMCAPRWRTLWSVRLPWALPQLFTGLKLAVSLALVGAVVAQITTPNTGLGAVIVLATQSADTALAFTAICLLAWLGVGLFYTVAVAERLLLPWTRHPVAG